jgi:large subunit ribosomal protein L13
MMKTTMARKEQVESGEIERKWFVVDAQELVLGRLAARIATVLRGKHKPIFTPHVDVGDFVIVVNAEKIQLTGNKREAKAYYHYSGYVSGLRTTSAAVVLDKDPQHVIEHAVRGMLPRNRLARQQIRKLKIYAGPEHPHEAQMPEPLPM